jgi:HD-GYP domain-containing protein (c-di-GMP phosphodiesterase class II)
MSGDRDVLRENQELIRAFSSAIRSQTIYPMGHSIVEQGCKRLAEGFAAMFENRESWTLSMIGGELVFEDAPVTGLSSEGRAFYQTLMVRRISSLTASKGVTEQELKVFIGHLLTDQGIIDQPGDPNGALDAAGIESIRIRKVHGQEQPSDVSVDTDEARDIYASLRHAMTRLFLSIFKPDSPTSLSLVQVLTERLTAALKAEPFAVVSRLHTRHRSDDLVAHSINTALLACVAARAIRLPDTRLSEIILAGLLHDIGLMDIPPKVENGILLASSDLRAYREHPARGVGILQTMHEAPMLAEVVAFEHHLHIDGSGFPPMENDRKTNPASGLIGLASMYDKVMHDDIYTPPEKIPRRLARLVGKAFEPALVAQFLAALGAYPPGTNVRLSNGEDALVVEANHNDLYRPFVRLFIKEGDEAGSPGKVLDLSECDPSSGEYCISIEKSIDAPGQMEFVEE